MIRVRRAIVWRTLGAAFLFVVALGALAPFLSADGFRERIREALETALNRKVDIGKVHYNLFTGPGFSVEGVLIGDTPEAGLEPFAHVDTLQARINIWRTVWNRKLAFSTLRLIDPSVNLVKMDRGGWNIQAFFRRATEGKGYNPHTSFPDIQVSRGRIDFKFGLLKSVFYINNADVDIYPNEGGDLVVRFSGEPARTDRGAQGFGRFSARGLLHRGSSGEDELNMALQLERSSLSELARLVNAGEIGVHGYITSDAVLSGPLSHVAISGDLNLSDLHRWDLMPAQGEGWTMKYTGRLNMRAQQLELETIAATPAAPVALKFKAADFVTSPKWAASMVLHDAPAASLVETARHMGAALPADVIAEGKVNGAIGVASPGGLNGELAFTDTALRVPNSGSVHMPAALLVIADRQVRLEPTEVTLENGHTARVEARYSAAQRVFSAAITARALSAADLRTGTARILSAGAIPMIAACRQGVWGGVLEYVQKGDEPALWTGHLELQNATLDLPGVAAPLRIADANVDIEGAQLQIRNVRGHVGPVAIQADYRIGAGDEPHHLKLAVPQADVAQIERLLLPTLRRSQGFFANLRLRRAAIPQWLKDRNIEGSVQIRNLMRDDAPVCAFRARLIWNGPAVELANAACEHSDMQASGSIAVNLAGSKPQYRISGEVQNLEYRSGTLDFDGDFSTSGIGRELLANLQSTGTFHGADIRLGTELPFRDIAGSYQIVSGISGPRLALTKVQATDGVDTLTGQGSTQTDGRLVLELTTGKKQVRMVGSLFPVRPITQ